MGIQSGWLRWIRVLLLASVMVGAAGCVPSAPPSARSTGGERSTVTSGSTAATQTPGSANESEALGVLRRFYRPEEPGDEGFDLLGKEHNDDAAWTRTTVLAATDYGTLVSSIEASQPGTAKGAMDVFRQLLGSRGATATYDTVVNSQWRIQDGSASDDDKRVAALIPASTVMGLLFGRDGRLLDKYVLRRASVDGDVLSAVYARPGKDDATLTFRITRSADGTARVAEWLNYGAFRKLLQSDDAAGILP
jgi:hypothetical protein